MRFEDFVANVRNLSIIPEYVMFQVIGHNQSAQNAISRWTNKGKLIRVKRGMYILNRKHKKHSPLLLYQVANILVSPSYVSLDSALSYYSLIPERVVEITSVCFKRRKKFSNVLGTFSYKKLHEDAYSQGITTSGQNDGTFLIANREKTVLDKIYFSHTKRYFDISYLFDSLRIEKDDLSTLDFPLLESYAEKYPTKKMRQVAKKIKEYYEF